MIIFLKLIEIDDFLIEIFFIYLHKCDGAAFTSLMQVKVNTFDGYAPNKLYPNQHH